MGTFLLELTESIIKWFKNVGVGRMVGYMVIGVCIIFTAVSLLNLDSTIARAINNNQEAQINKHDRAIEVRYQNTYKINKILNEILYRYGADRVCVIEMHNGTKNIAGLPFIYGEMSYEVYSDSIMPVDSEYTRFNLSRLMFPSYMLDNNIFFGDIDDVCEIDEKFGERLISNNSTYICGHTLHGCDNAIGYLGVVWCGDEPDDINGLKNEIATYANKLSVLLDEK